MNQAKSNKGVGFKKDWDQGGKNDIMYQQSLRLFSTKYYTTLSFFNKKWL